MSISRKIEKKLEHAFPGAKFRVLINGDDVSVDFIGGNNYAERYPTHEAAADAMAEIIRTVLPDYKWTDYRV